jgi:N-acetylglucosamine-6-phosphate deacetylase
VIAGSALTMVEGLKNLVNFGIAPETAVKMASSNPARILRLHRLGEISPGFFADLTLLSPDFTVIMSMVRGRFVFGA